MSSFDDISRQIIDLAKVDMTPLHKEIGEILVSSIGRSFRKGGRYNPSKEPDQYAGGSATWLKSARASEDSGVTLMQRGILAKSVTYRADARSVTIGTNLVYGAIHHFGGEAGRKIDGKYSVTLPARPWLVVQPEDYEEIEQAALSFFERVFGGT